jgi:hypothetical protein
MYSIELGFATISPSSKGVGEVVKTYNLWLGGEKCTFFFHYFITQNTHI